ncbi:serine--tRNA ligase [Candidatus Parcubacteria bacterium]|nr:MAG: serine--tRNA ligase [Candidatus Parcubacteria bacterium]
MINKDLILEDVDKVKTALKNRGIKDIDIVEIKEVLQQERALKKKLEDKRAQLNKVSEEIAKAGNKKTKEMLEQAGKLKNDIKYNEDQYKKYTEALRGLKKIPNIPLDSVPIGKSETDNKVIREWGKKPDFEFKPEDYLALTEPNFIDIERAGKVSGSRFGYIKSELVQLEFALVQFAMNELSKKGFMPVVPPVIIKEEMMQAMGYVDTEKDRAERYYLEKDNSYLVGTSEQSIGPMHAGEVLDQKHLPLRYVAFSTCFRREAGSYGKDTKGILRVHQFDKVEMFIFSKSEDSEKEHKLLLSCEEELMQKLEIPYRVVELCTADLSAPSAATFDIEAWMPGQNVYRETHSCSNTTDFQSRRLNIKYKDGKENKLVHMLNGTAFAIGRMLIAIIENYQQKDGSIKIPKALHSYLSFKEIKTR